MRATDDLRHQGCVATRDRYGTRRGIGGRRTKQPPPTFDRGLGLAYDNEEISVSVVAAPAAAIIKLDEVGQPAFGESQATGRVAVAEMGHRALCHEEDIRR